MVRRQDISDEIFESKPSKKQKNPSSPFLHVLSDERIGATLRLMTKPTGTPLTAEITREVCQRAGSKAHIAGSIANIGKQYVVGLKAVNCQSGNTLAWKQVQAAAKEKVLDALGDAATKLRTELGESLSSVERFDTRMEEATTASFEALKAYSLGDKNWNENGNVHAIPFFKQAIELDPNFAMAYAYGNSLIMLSNPPAATIEKRQQRSGG